MIYFDHNATTPLRPEVRDAMLRVLDEFHGNPSSVHAEGAAAHALVILHDGSAAQKSEVK